MAAGAWEDHMVAETMVQEAEVEAVVVVDMAGETDTNFQIPSGLHCINRRG